jgi:hypothetical protein
MVWYDVLSKQINGDIMITFPRLGLYTKAELYDTGALNIDQFPTTKLDVIISNPIGFGVTSYRISKVKKDGKYVYNVADYWEVL